MEICEKNRCTACKACINVCMKDAITFQEDEKGFSYPLISEDRCINCKACVNVCPRNTGMMLNNNEPKVYAGFTKNKVIRKNSSSGGIFSELARSIIDEGGIVFASRFENNCKEVVFDYCSSVENLKLFRGSKYVQSNPGLIYRKVKSSLLEGKKVLFIGVPCQVDGLKKFLNKEYDNLLLIDIICHGVPSPKLWREYLSYLEKENDGNILNASFRYKKPSWTKSSLKIDFDNQKRIVKSKFDDPYLIAFSKEMSMRENCYSCEYTSIHRAGDITLADFWGFHSYDFKMRNNEKGISLVLLNNSKGKFAFEKIKNKIMFQERTLTEAMRGNRSLKQPWKKSINYEKFWNEYINGEGMLKAYQEYCKPYRFPIKTDISWFIINHMYLIPKFIIKKHRKRKKR